MEQDAIVIDNGSGTCKAGFAGDDGPRCVISATVGKSRYDFIESQDENAVQIGRPTFIGDEAQKTRDFLDLKYPIKRGTVVNWDDAEKLWEFCFQSLKVDPTERNVLMSEPVLNPISCRERMLECMFETFKLPGFFMRSSPTLSLFACGRGLGLVVDVGEGLTQITPIHFGHVPKHAIRRQDFGGSDVTTYLARLLQERGYSFSTQAEVEDVREIKERSSFVANRSKVMNENNSYDIDQSYILPDGLMVDIGKERFQCSECIFSPKQLTNEYSNLKGIGELLEESLNGIDMDMRKDFYTNVILSGGVTVTSGFEQRMEQTLEDLVKARTSKSKMVSKCVAPIERKYSVFIGGSIEASMSTFQDAWLTKAQYEEFGPSIAHRRFI